MKHKYDLPKAPGAECQRCTLVSRPFVPSYIPEDAEIMFVGEAPAYNEVHDQRPFVGQSGQLLKLTLAHNGVDIDDTARVNTVACWPKNNRTPTNNEIACCAGRLEAEIDAFEEAGGRTIVPLGKVAMQQLTGDTQSSITKKRGHWLEYSNMMMMPAYHPAYVLRRHSVFKDFRRDIRWATQGYKPHWLLDEPEVVYIDDINTLIDMLEAIPEDAVVSFDLETDQIMWYDRPGHPADIVLMLGMSWEVGWGIIVHPDLLYDDPDATAILNEFFARDDVTFVAHNGKFDVIFLRTLGIEARVDFDTMLAHYCVWELAGSHGLKQLALEYYGLPDYEQDLVQKYLRNRNDYYSKVPYENLAIYCVWDNLVTWQLYHDLTEQMIAEGVYDAPFKTLIMPLQAALLELEWNGMPIDREHVEKWQQRLFDYTDRLEDEMGEMADDLTFNPRSPKQVSHIMYEVLNLPRPLQANVSPDSTSKTAIVHIKQGQSPFVDKLRLYRRAHKMNRSYLKNLLLYADTEDKVHPGALVHGTEVGRLSFRNPAIQTIPRPYEDVYGAIVRSSFIAPPGYKFIIADYSQAELRVAGILANEEFLLDAYRNNRDLHTEVAIAMYGQGYTPENRAHCKMFNFSYLYGGSERSFALDAGLPIALARKFVRDYNAVMPDLAQYKKNQLALAREQGYVTSFFGRKRRFPLITKQNINEVRKACVHMPISSAASDLTQISLLEAADKGHHLVLTVHDSIGEIALENEAEDRAKDLHDIMVNVATRYFPQIPWGVDVDIRERWSPLPEVIHGAEVRRVFGQDDSHPEVD